MFHIEKWGRTGQVSTRQKDFILDPFEIFEQMHLLNEALHLPCIMN